MSNRIRQVMLSLKQPLAYRYSAYERGTIYMKKELSLYILFRDIINFQYAKVLLYVLNFIIYTLQGFPNCDTIKIVH